MIKVSRKTGSYCDYGSNSPVKMDYYRAGHYEKGYSDDEYVIRGPNTRRLSRRRMLRDLSSSDPLSSMRLTIMLKHPGQKAAGGTVKKPLDEESVSDGRINIVGSQFRKGGKVVLYRKSPAMTGQVTQFAWMLVRALSIGASD